MEQRVRVAVWTMAALGAAALLAAGCKSNDAASGPGAGAPGSIITVTGKILGQNNLGVAGVPVFVTGKPSTNSDASGNFTFTNVTVPYDVTVVNAATKAALIYKALSRSDPTLTFIGLTAGTTRGATCNGKISGGAFLPNQPVDHLTRVVYASPEASAGTTTGADGTFGSTVNWNGPSTTTGAIYALQYQAAAGLPVAAGYKGYGVKNGVVLTDGNPLINQFDTLQTIATAQLTGAVTVAAGYSVYDKILNMRLSGTAAMEVFSDPTTTGTLSYYTPSITGITLIFGVAARVGGPGTSQSIMFRPGLAPNASGVAITLPASPEPSLPIAGATGIDTAVTFSWTSFTGGMHLVVFAGGVGDPSYYVFTSGTSTTIPNLQPFGLGLPSNKAYTWQVYGFAPFANSDAAAGQAGFLGPLTNVAALTGDAYIAISAKRAFTTKP